MKPRKTTIKNKNKEINKITIDAKHQKEIDKKVKESYPLKNDTFMLFAQHKNFCQEFLRVILQDKKLEVLENDIQKNLPTAFSKDVILDMFCKLGDGSIVNVEIQLTDEVGHERRIFMYASKIKSYLTEVGTKYKDLKDIITIYLTKDDILKKGSTVYEVKMDIVSDQGEYISPWDAGLKVYYVNTVGLTNKNINEYLQLLLDKTTFNKKYKVTSKTKKEYYEKGGQKMSKELRQMMEEERTKGKKEGKKEGMIEAFVGMVKDGLLSMKDAAKRLGMTEKEFTKIAGIY